MASKRRQRRKKCGTKRQLTREEAHAMVWRLNKNSVHRLDAYQCPYGDHWHVGHRPKKTQYAISAKLRDRKRE